MTESGDRALQRTALALLFGEAVKMQDISIPVLIGEAAESAESGRRQMNRYARLALDEGDGDTSERVRCN